jgi:PAS domain S-box-containing protein
VKTRRKNPAAPLAQRKKNGAAGKIKRRPSAGKGTRPKASANNRKRQPTVARTQKEETSRTHRALLTEPVEDFLRSQKLFEAFVDNLAGFAWIKDLEGRYVYVNKTFLQLADAVGKTDAEIWPAEVASAYNANDRQVVQRKKVLQTVEPFAMDPAQGRHLVSKFPIFDQHGAVVMVGGVSVDVSELTKAERALNAQALRYKTLMETSKDSIYVLNSNGDLQEANAAFLRRRGYTAAEVKRLNVLDWDAQLEPHQFQERLRQVMGRSSVFETRHRCKDGSIFDVEVCATGLPVDGEQFVFCVTREITERKQAEAALAVRARQQAVVAELGKLALAGGDLQPLFDRTVVQVAKTLGVEFCKVLELLPDGSALKLVAGVGWKEGLVGQATVGSGCDSQAGFTLLSQDLVVVDDLRTETRFQGPALLRDHNVVSGLSVVIGEIEKPFGILGAHTTEQRRFTIDDAHFFQSIANVLAEAIHRKRAEEAMQESERKYRELVELIHDLVWAVDREGRITFMSPASRHIYGREPEEMIGHLFTDFMLPDEARRSMAVLAKMIATGDSVIDLENRLLHRDGHEIVLSANAVLLRDAAGNIVGTTGTSRDITARKLAEEALRESEQRFREFAENIHEVFWMSDPENTRMFYVSPAYETIWGRTREKLYSSPASWMDAIHPDDKERMVRTRSNRDSAFPHDNTYRIVRPDGSVRWIRDRGFPVHDDRGAVVRFAGIAEDITVRKETEEAQERGLSLMLATLESTADGILVVNTEGKIEAFNRLFARMWRLSDEVLASKEDARALDCVLDQLIEPKKFLEKVRYLYRHPEEESFDRLVFKDGRVFERYSRPQLVGGKVVGRVWSFRDATERRRAAKALEEANERLRFISRRLFQVQEDERRHLARELHDEIGQTLTAAKINLQIIAQDVPEKMAGRLNDSIQLLDRLLGQVRQLSLDLRPPLLDELGLVPALRWLLDQQAQRAGLRVTFRTDVDGLLIDPTVQTTCFRVAQEAVTNIIRHSGAQKVAFLLQRRAGRLSLKVRDDGAGFDPAAFPQGNAHPSSLGLVSMKERILLVGGGLEVRSSPGKGTEIRAWFPVPVGEQPSRSETS